MNAKNVEGLSLDAGDFNPYELVRYRHQDGSVLTFTHAFAFLCQDTPPMRKPIERYFVFSEHNGYHEFFVDDGVLEVATRSSRGTGRTPWKTPTPAYHRKVQRRFITITDRPNNRAWLTRCDEHDQGGC